MKPFHLFFFILISLNIFSQNGKDNVLENLLISDDYENAKIYTLKKLQTDSVGVDNAYYYAKVSFVYLRLGVLDSAMYYSKNALNYLSSNVSHEVWKSLAYCYTRFGKLDSAIIYTQKIFASVENTNKYETIRYAHTLMGIIHFQNKLFAESLNHYLKALEFSLLAKSNYLLKIDYYNIGLAQNALKKYEEGIASLTIAEKFALESKDKRLLTRIYGTMADNYASQNNDEKRQVFLKKANEIANSIKDEKLITMGKSHQMEWNFKNNQPSKAYSEGETITQNIKQQDLPHIQLKSDSMMYALAKQNNETDKALVYLESFYKTKIQMLNENGKKQLAEIEASYQLKNKNLIIQKKEIEVISAKRVNKITFLITTIVFLLMLFYAYAYYKNKKYVHVMYLKEKEKDLQIAKLKERIELNSKHLDTSVHEDSNIEIYNEESIEGTYLNDHRLFEIYHNFMQLLETDKLYLNTELSQSMIIKLIGTNKKYLYESISKFSDLNFRGIINRLRINEAKRIIRSRVNNKEELNFSTIFSECGFNSNASFYRSFKSITGITPNEYADEFRKDSLGILN